MMLNNKIYVNLIQVQIDRITLLFEYLMFARIVIFKTVNYLL
jgi:hypothetical protein